MNYRHHFHAGNFADVFKHAVLVRLVRALQTKPKGLLLLDTHAGRGRYDLQAAAKGDTLERQPEWPEGIGRLWSRPNLPAGVADYLARVVAFDRAAGNTLDAPRFYPGSPRLLEALARPQDRLALCELHPVENQALQAEFAFTPWVVVQLLDGYTAVRALLPPPERRALVLIDPPFEAQDEFARIVSALGEGLRRLPAGTFAIWYPLTERARVDDFFAELRTRRLPPTLVAELIINPSAPKMKGCGLVIVNPPWQFDREAEELAVWLAGALAQGPGSGAQVWWLVPEV